MPYLAIPILMMSASALAFGSMALVGIALVHGAIRR
jgi:hypothetical protein